MSYIYKLNSKGYVIGKYPSNHDGYVPDGFTDVVPPTINKEGFVPRFDEGTGGYEIERDFTGATVYDVTNGKEVLNPTPYISGRFTTVKPESIPAMFVNEEWTQAISIKPVRTVIEEPTIEHEGTEFPVSYDMLWRIQASESYRRYTGTKKLVKVREGEVVEVEDTNTLQRLMFRALVGYEV